MEESNFYTISDNPIYNSEIRKLKNSDPANARTVFNPLFERIINNIEAVRLNEKKLIDEHNKSETAHKGMSFPANGGNADTVDGYHASEFTKYREFNSLDELAETQYEGLFYIGGSEEITGISLKSGRDMDIQPDNTDFLEIYTRIYRDKDGKMYAAADVYNTEYDFWTKRDLKTFSFDGHLHSVSDIEDFPKSLPASGGNADTVGGKQASDFALKNHSHTDFSAWDSDSDSDTSWGVSISASGINFQWNDDINDSELHISENGLMGGGSFLPAISNFGNISAQSFLGNGSNLTNVNADTVDGKHASDFQLIKSGYQNCTDWNSLTTSGMYGLVKANQKNAPDRFNMFFPMVFAYSDSGITQLAIPYAISNNSGDYDLHKIFIRHCFNGDWDNWSMIGNGCNADTAQFINTYSKTNGYNSNNYGNFVHNGTSANDSWCITSNNVNPTFKVYYESGNVSANGTITANLFNGNGSNLTNLNASYVNKKTVSFNASAGNWYRLAKGKPHNNSDNTGACGIMTIMADVHNYHSSDVISLTQNGGDGNFTILNHSRFNQFFTKFRMSKGADNYMYIDGYTNTAANSVTVTFTFSGIGWTLCESIVSVNAGFGVLVMEKEPEIN